MGKRQPHSQWQPGDVLADRFRLEEQIGHGGMGAVWRAEHLKLRAPVAIKLLHESSSDAEDADARFLTEAQAAAAIRGNNVVQILDYGLDEGTPFIVMELLSGVSLKERLREEERLSPELTAQVVTSILSAIGRGHRQGIIHRDLKPGNVQLVDDEDGLVVKVLDFGIAKVERFEVDASAGTPAGSVLGTPFYMSPEQARGREEVDHRSDLWAVGVIAFQCLTGERPFESETLGDLIMKICLEPLPVPSELHSVPSGFDEWFHKAMARNPDDRFQSTREMSAALREAMMADLPPSSRRFFDALDDSGARRSEAPLSVPAGAVDASDRPMAPTKSVDHRKAESERALESDELLDRTGLTQSRTVNRAASSPPPSIAAVGGGTGLLGLGLIAVAGAALIVALRLGSDDPSPATPSTVNSTAESATPVDAPSPVALSPRGTASPTAAKSGSQPAASSSAVGSASSALSVAAPSPRRVPPPAQPRTSQPSPKGIDFGF